MYEIEYKESFFRSFDKLKEKVDSKRVRDRIEQLKFRPFGIGKRLVGHPYWSLRIGKRTRVIYRIEGNKVIVIDILERKHDYKELG